MSLAQQLAQARRERLARMNALPPRPVMSPRDFGRPLPGPILAPNRHEWWPNKNATPNPAAPTPVYAAPRHPRIKDIQHAVCAYYGVTLLDMISERRTKELVRPRQVAMYLCRKLTPRGYLDIGGRFGGRDHTTAMWGVRQVERRLRDDAELAAEVAALSAELERGGA